MIVKIRRKTTALYEDSFSKYDYYVSDIFLEFVFQPVFVSHVVYLNDPNCH